MSHIYPGNRMSISCTNTGNLEFSRSVSEEDIDNLNEEIEILKAENISLREDLDKVIRRLDLHDEFKPGGSGMIDASIDYHERDPSSPISEEGYDIEESNMEEDIEEEGSDIEEGIEEEDSDIEEGIEEGIEEEGSDI